MFKLNKNLIVAGASAVLVVGVAMASTSPAPSQTVSITPTDQGAPDDTYTGPLTTPSASPEATPTAAPTNTPPSPSVAPAPSQAVSDPSPTPTPSPTVTGHNGIARKLYADNGKDFIYYCDYQFSDGTSVTQQVGSGSDSPGRQEIQVNCSEKPF